MTLGTLAHEYFINKTNEHGADSGKNFQFSDLMAINKLLLGTMTTEQTHIVEHEHFKHKANEYKYEPDISAKRGYKIGELITNNKLLLKLMTDQQIKNVITGEDIIHTCTYFSETELEKIANTTTQ
ncbi:hypothetical protein [Photobacterium kishitanii]|uniref:Uncharacterized protein n=1 Tax=Photobacterium kishitanii TaxID=318456 RepID=A0A2T3KB01_9GAMM|nr:hypothetical protein [Photobacterium kishitanii]PSU89796.1 hypothetical protein C9J27_24245 [Photobacterium kishitanii]